MIQERKRAKAKDIEDPIHATLQDTHQNYDACVGLLLDSIKQADVVSSVPPAPRLVCIELNPGPPEPTRRSARLHQQAHPQLHLLLLLLPLPRHNQVRLDQWRLHLLQRLLQVQLVHQQAWLLLGHSPQQFRFLWPNAQHLVTPAGDSQKNRRINDLSLVLVVSQFPIAL